MKFNYSMCIAPGGIASRASATMVSDGCATVTSRDPVPGSLCTVLRTCTAPPQKTEKEWPGGPRRRCCGRGIQAAPRWGLCDPQCLFWSWLHQPRQTIFGRARATSNAYACLVSLNAIQTHHHHHHPCLDGGSFDFSPAPPPPPPPHQGVGHSVSAQSFQTGHLLRRVRTRGFFFFFLD